MFICVWYSRCVLMPIEWETMICTHFWCANIIDSIIRPFPLGVFAIYLVVEMVLCIIVTLSALTHCLCGNVFDLIPMICYETRYWWLGSIFKITQFGVITTTLITMSLPVCLLLLPQVWWQRDPCPNGSL